MDLKKTNRVLEEFANYYKQLDFKGIKKLLGHNPRWFYLDSIQEEFKKLKSEGIVSLEAYPGVCSGCNKGCKGFTFIDEKTGYYIDLILESKEGEITFINECFGLESINKNLNKKQFGIMDPLATCTYRFK